MPIPSKKNERFKLRIKLDVGSPGDIIEYDPEWGEWMIGSTIYNTRGSIFEGEMAMLLGTLRANRITSILEPVTKHD